MENRRGATSIVYTIVLEAMHVIIQLTDRLEAKLGLHEEVLNKRRCDNLLYGRKKSFEIHALDDKASLEVNMVHR